MSMKSTRITSLLVVGMFALTAFCLIVPDSDGAESFDVTDSTGKTFTFDGPAKKIVSFGPHTLTVLEMVDKKDRIVAIDYYSTSEYLKDDPRVEGWDPPSIGKVGKDTVDTVVANLVQLVEKGEFNTETDVVFSIAWSSLTAPGGLRDQLVEKGFKVLCLKGDTYDEIVGVVETIAKVIGSNKGKQIAEGMTQTKIEIQNKVQENVAEEDRVKFVMAWYRSGTLSIGNKTSVAVNFAEIAGGVNAGENPDSEEGLIPSEVSAIIQAGPDIVLTSNYTGTSEQYQKKVLHTSEIPVLALKSSWNNYCPDAELGLKTIAKYLYPDLFQDFEASPDADFAPAGSGTSMDIGKSVAIVAFAGLVLAISAYFVAKI